jgi:hypothetical protein
MMFVHLVVAHQARIASDIPFIGANLPPSPYARRAGAEQRGTGTMDDLIDVCFTRGSGH